MGYAKYAEDNIEIRNNNMAMSGLSDYCDSLHHFRRTVTYTPTEQRRKIGYVTYNHIENRVEIYFFGRPSESIRQLLNNNYWHWHSNKNCWYHADTGESKDFAEMIVNL